MEHYNRLTPVEAELLAWLVEEAGEVVQAVGKIQRHGLECVCVDGHYNNIGNLEKELGQLMGVMHMMRDNHMLNMRAVVNAEDAKLAELRITPGRLHHVKIP